MIGLYDKDWNLIAVFDTDEEAFDFAIKSAVPAFKIKDL